MSIQVEIQNGVAEEKSGKVSRGPRAGEDYHIRQQEAWIHNGKAYPERFTLSLGDQPAYPPGMYEIAPASLTVGEYGRLEFARQMVLLRIAESKAVKAA